MAKKTMTVKRLSKKLDKIESEIDVIAINRELRKMQPWVLE